MKPKTKQKWKMLAHLLLSCAISFVLLYVFVFFGGWRYFQSGDPILMEFGASYVIGFIFWVMLENDHFYKKKIDELEKRLEQLEQHK